jgi:hypothetical protein
MSDIVVVALVSAVPTTIAAVTAGAAFLVGLLNRKDLKKAEKLSLEISDRVDGQLDAKIKEIRLAERAIGVKEGEERIEAKFAGLEAIQVATKTAVDAANAVAQRNIEAAKIIADALVAKQAADALIVAQSQPATPPPPA